MISQNEDKKFNKVISIFMAFVLCVSVACVANTSLSADVAHAASAKKITKVVPSKTKYTYTGKKINVKVKVYAGKTKVTSKNYSTTFYKKANKKWKKIKKSSIKAVGTYKVTVKAKKSYKGSKSRTFKVVKASKTVNLKTAPIGTTYTVNGVTYTKVDATHKSHKEGKYFITELIEIKYPAGTPANICHSAHIWYKHSDYYYWCKSKFCDAKKYIPHEHTWTPRTYKCIFVGEDVDPSGMIFVPETWQCTKCTEIKSE